MAKQYNKFHPIQLYLFAKNIADNYGLPFFFLIVTSYFANVGAIHDMIPTIQLPYYQSAGVDGQTQAEMAAIAKSPFSCKGFIGVISDILPLFGRSKFYYLIIYSIIGIGCCISLALLPIEIVGNEPIIAAIFFFGLNLYSAAFDLLLEAKYIELMQKNPKIKADLLSFAWFNQLLGQFVPSFTVGVIAELADVRFIFYIFLPFTFIPLIPIFLGGVIHDTVPANQSNKLNIPKIKAQWRLIFLTFLQALFAFGTILITFYGSPIAQLVYILAVSLSISILAFFLLDRITAGFNLYTYFTQSLYVNLQGAIDYFYRADELCVEDGPQFSYIVMNSVAPFIMTIGQLIAVFIFQLFLYKTKFRTIYWATTLLRVFGGVFDFILVKRWNKLIGVPDVIIFLGGYATVSRIAYMLDFLPTVFMMSKLCPKNLEATMYSFLAGLFHFGGTSSYYIGVFLMEIFNIQSIRIPEKNIECDFTNLPLIIIIGHFLFPLLTIPLIFILVPGIRLNENVIFKDGKPITKKIGPAHQVNSYVESPIS